MSMWEAPQGLKPLSIRLLRRGTSAAKAAVFEAESGTAEAVPSYKAKHLRG
jgi:hypothetical protein